MKQAVIVVIVIGLAGIAAFIGYRYFMLNTKDSVVNHQKYLENLSNPAEIYQSFDRAVVFALQYRCGSDGQADADRY